MKNNLQSQTGCGKTRCMLVFGTRPEVIKLAPVALAMRERPDSFDCLLASTGQHRELSHQALGIFGLKPDIDLDLMREDQGIGDFLGLALARLDGVMQREKPDWVLVQGDTGTVLAAAIAAYYRKIPVAHVEAGLRTYDLMGPHPEEGNRQMVSRIASLHFAPTEGARQRLRSEGISDGLIAVTGNTVVDAVQWIHARLTKKEKEEVARLSDGSSRLVLTTIHRRESFGKPLRGMCEAIKALAEEGGLGLSFVMPVHPNPHVSAVVRELLGGAKNVRLVPPLDYGVLLGLMARSWLIVTDSGGLQEEAPCFSTPVLVLRDRTERPEGIDAGIAKLAGTEKNTIIEAVSRLADDKQAYENMRGQNNPYGDGRAAQRIMDRLKAEKGRR